MYEICVLLGAEREIQEAYNSLEHHDERAAAHFEETVDAALDSLRAYAYLGPASVPPFRRLVFVGTHYGMFYEVVGNRVLVHAFLDLRQDPDAVRRRLGL